MHTKDLGFAVIKSSEHVPAFIEASCKQSYLRSKHLYKKRLTRKITITLCSTQQEWLKAIKYYRWPNAAGVVLRNGDIALKAPDLLVVQAKEKQRTRISGHAMKKWHKQLEKWSTKAVKNVILHEFSHVFWTHHYKTTQPNWLNEGLASAVQITHSITKEEVINGIKERKLNEKSLLYRMRIQKHPGGKKGGLYYYNLWRYFTLFVTNNNLRRAVQFMDEYSKRPSRKKYEHLFKKYFGMTEKEAWNAFIN